MKLFFGRRATLLSLALFGAAPVALVSGCSGGGSGPALTSAQRAGSFLVPYNHVATLLLSRSGTALSGKLSVAIDPNSPYSFDGPVSSPFAAGVYPVMGQINADGTFSVSGAYDRTPSTFTLSGVLPTSTTDGSFQLQFPGSTDAGTIPALSKPLPTPIPTPLPSALALMVTPSPDSNFVPLGFNTASFTHTTLGGAATFAASVYGGSYYGGGIGIEVPSLSAVGGSTISFSPTSTQTSVVLLDNPSTGTPTSFYARGGSITLSQVSLQTAKLTFNNVVFSSLPNTTAKGSVTVNGTAFGPVVQ